MMGPQDFIVTDKGEYYIQRLAEMVVTSSPRMTDDQINDYVVLTMVDKSTDVAVKEWNQYARGTVRRLFEAGYLEQA